MEILWAEFLMNARLRAARILLAVYAHHVTSESRDVCIYARVVHFNREYQVKKDNRGIRESMRENEK